MLQKFLHKIITLSIVLVMSANYATDVRIRSQSVDLARQLSGIDNKSINLYDMGDIYGSFAVTPEYTRSFQDHKIAQSLFGNAIANRKSCDNHNIGSLRISGSQSPFREPGDLLADYFGLPLDYQSTIFVKPVIQNGLLDFDLYLGLDRLLCGLWFDIHAPVVYANWRLNMNELPSEMGTIGYPAGYFGPDAVPVDNLNKSFISYLQGAVPTIGGDVTFKPLKNSKLINKGCKSDTGNACCAGLIEYKHHNSTVRLSDIRMALGWNFAQDEDYHFGAGILGAAPTGSRVDDRYLFQPFVGNGHHWEFGGRFTSHYTFWRSCDYDQSVEFSLDFDITYMFATRQFRVFDLTAGGNNSRYMLAELMTSTVTDHLEGNVTAGFPVGPAPGYFSAQYQFDNVLTPVANIAAQKVKVSQPYQVDLNAMITYNYCGIKWDTGYNFWMTGAEKFGRACISVLGHDTTYALKGDASVYGFDSVNAYAPVALSATENAATICSGTNYPVGTTTPFPSTNIGIDNARYAYGDATGGTANNALVNVTAGAVAANQTETSIQPIFMATSDLNLTSARSKGLSHKIFSYIGYTWEDRECIQPYLGIGGKAEFVGGQKGFPSGSCANNVGCGAEDYTSSVCGDLSSCSDSKCRRTNISEWGIWIKGGFMFD